MRLFAVKTDTEYCGTDMYQYLAAESLGRAEMEAQDLALENGSQFYDGDSDGDREEYDQGCTYEVVYLGDMPEDGKFPKECPSVHF